jgi:dUTP pyrophosphatase
VNLRLVRVRENVPPPRYATDGAAGLDFFIPDEFFARDPLSGEPLRGHFYTKPGALPLGWKIAIPPGYVGLLFIRSGVSKGGLSLQNAVGVIDSDFRGELTALLQTADLRLIQAERVVQLVIVRAERPDLEVVEDLDDTTRGEGGFGSTG